MPSTHAIAHALMSGAMLMSSDEAWRDFGFKRRPQERPWHLRILCGKAREVELRLTRLLFCCAIAAHVKAGCMTTGDGITAVNTSLKDAECVRLLGFESELDAASHLGCLVLHLAECETTRWGRVLAGWLHLPGIRDANERTQMIHGTVVLVSSLRQMIHELSTARQPTGDLVEKVWNAPRLRVSVR